MRFVSGGKHQERLMQHCAPDSSAREQLLCDLAWPPRAVVLLRWLIKEHLMETNPTGGGGNGCSTGPRRLGRSALGIYVTSGAGRLVGRPCKRDDLRLPPGLKRAGKRGRKCFPLSAQLDGALTGLSPRTLPGHRDASRAVVADGGGARWERRKGGRRTALGPGNDRGRGPWGPRGAVSAW
ncbi:hypothetical protein HPB50_022228 [Hyalomma asiaticum]|uniref:Uncharacterized protein n=1 Tax=Hyalomma asiaticum TaxID=266040 RepID=A0ACB7TK70_HYAAI|nr:hypothetical protein HPB50_022228 [Hyalomma asiaticum]